MAKLRVLFIGGSGVISSACSRVAVESGIELFVLNRGRNATRPLPPGVNMLRADIRDTRSVRDVLKELDDVLTWNQIAWSLAAALGVTARLVHVPSDVIAAAEPDWGAGLLGDKAHSMVFDNAKVRSIVPGWRAVIPFERGAGQIVEWYQADPARQVTDQALDAVMDKLAAAWTV